MQVRVAWPGWLRVVFAVVALVAIPLVAHADEMPPTSLQGRFRGNLTAQDGTSGGDFSVTIDIREDRFSVRWPPRIAVTFEATDRAGVFRPTDRTNPLTGSASYWARLDGVRLVVYELQIDEHGGYDIRNYAYASSEGGLDLVIHRIRSGAAPGVSRARLVRQGG